MRKAHLVPLATSLVLTLTCVLGRTQEPSVTSSHSSLDLEKAHRWSFRDAGTGRRGVLFDLDGDGAQEIIFSGADADRHGASLVHVLGGDGRHLKGWPQESRMKRPKVPLIGDVDGDGNVEIVVSDGMRVSQWDHKGNVIGNKGAKVPGVRNYMHNYGEGALGDVDGDGKLELVYGTWSKQIVALRLRPFPVMVEGFPLEIEGVVGGAPALADLDGDGREEIVIPGEKSACYFIDVEKTGVQVRKALGADGRPLHLPSRGAAAIGVLEGGGEPSVLIGSYTGKLHAFTPRGEAVWSFLGGQNIYAPPALVDINGDGKREIIYPIYDNFKRGLMVITSEGALLPGWPKTYHRNGQSGVVAGDVDGDERVDVLAADFHGNIYIYSAEGARMAIIMDGGKHPMLGDVNGNGRLDLVLIREALGVDRYELPAPASPPPPWPMERLDARRSGALPGP